MMSLGLRNGSTPSFLDHQAGDPAMDAVARFLQDTSRMLDWLLSTHLPDHFDVRTSLSIGMPSAPHSILPHLLQDAYSHGFPDGRMAPLQAFQYPSYRPGVTYHGDPHLGLQQWYNQRPSGSSIEGVRHPDIAQFRNGMSSSLGRQPERGNQPATLVHRDALKRFVEEMKKTVQEWFAKHSLLAQGKSVSFDPPVRLTKVPDAAHPFQNSSHASVHSAGPSFLFSRPAEVGPVSQGLAGNGPGPNEVTRFSQQETKTPEKARALQGHCTVTKNSIDRSLDKVVEDMACQLFGNDVDQETFTDAEKHPEKVGSNAGTKPSATQAEQCEDSLATIDGESHVIFTTPTAKEITGTQASDFATPVRDGEKLKVALVASTSSTPAPRRKRLAVKTQMPRRPVEMVSSPDWLPPGWVTEVKIRGSGNSAGSKDKYYVDPVTKRRFRSRKEVYAFLEFGTLDKTRKAEETPVRKLLGPPDVVPAIPDTGPGAAPVAPNEGPRAPLVAPNEEPAIQDGQAEARPAARPAIGPVLEPDLPAAPLEMEKSAKKKRGRPPGSRSKRQNAPPSTSAAPAPPTILPSTIAAPSGVMGNMFMPYRTGQPSDWLVYESVATLPFPMFDPFYFSDYNVNKANGNKGPPGRPWFFTGPEASWRPSMGTPPYGATSQSPGSSPREPSNGRKRPLKKSPDRATPAPANV